MIKINFELSIKTYFIHIDLKSFETEYG